MNSKRIRTFFYKLNVLGSKDEQSDVVALWGIIGDGNNYLNGVSKIQGKNSGTGRSYEFRNIKISDTYVSGSLATLRMDAPKIREIDGGEKDISLGSGEALLERNYFIYYRDERLLVWQFNMAANHVVNFVGMLMALDGGKKLIGYDHVIKNAFSLDEDAIIEYVDVKFSSPKKAIQREEIKNLDPTDWGFNPFQIMAATEARQFSIKLRNSTQSGLAEGMGKLIKDTMGLSVTKRLKVSVEGADEPVDLLSERYSYLEEIEYVGRTPGSDLMLNAIRSSKRRYDYEKKN